MATPSASFAVPITEFAAALLAERELAPRARLLAEQIASVFPGSAVALYIIEDRDAPAWTPKAKAGDIEFQERLIELAHGTLGRLAEAPEPLIFAGKELPREEYAHLNVRRTVTSLAYWPVVDDDLLIGAVEIISYEKPITKAALEPLSELSGVAAMALAAGLVYEHERNQSLGSITRLTQMYDLEKAFHSSLNMEDLVPIIASKIQEILNVQAVNVWMVEDEDTLLLMGQAGQDPANELGMRQHTGEGVAAAVSESAEALLIEAADDERLAKRNVGVEEGAAFSLMAAPLKENEAVTGVVELLNKLDGTAFEEDDLFALTTICDAAAGALHNASMFQAERKVEILNTLVKVSQEITSTLHLDRVLHTVVNTTQAAIPFERAAVALEQRGKHKLMAISGMEQIISGDPEVKRLDDLLYWVSMQGELFVVQKDDDIIAPSPEVEEKFKTYFSESGVRGFFATPLADDLGRIGTLSFESSDPEFLNAAHFEMIRVLAGQVTVALRNAEMYKEVPFIGILEPILKEKQKFLALEKGRRISRLAIAAAVAIFLVAVPLPMRVDGTAAVLPVHMAQIQPEVEGVIRQVFVREGQHVNKGDVLADLEDWNYRAALDQAQARYQTALAEMNRALAANDGGTAGVQRAQADFWGAEVQRDRERLEHTHLRSPIDGTVATPHVENLVGKHLEAGDLFAQVVDSSAMTVDVALDEDDVVLAKAGASASVKLDGFPARTFRGKVTVVSPKSEAQGDTRVFFARVAVPNPQNLIRTGMQGRGKVSAGWHPAGFVLLRGPALWLWAKLWSWFGF